jgi:pimeloyl-ACP methyl ester carboxylesterase
MTCNCFTCCLGTITMCGCRDRLVRKLAFAPPPQLPLDDKSDFDQSLRNNENDPRVLTRASLSFNLDLVEGEDFSPFTIAIDKPQCGTSKRVHGAHIRAEKNMSRTCILFSHGNAADVRTSLPSLHALSEDLQVDIVVYDYPGYGFSSGHPTERGTYQSIREVYDYLITEYSPSRLIVYGQSIGSGPSVDLACDTSRPIGGLILHCPIASGLRVIIEMEGKAPWFDLYRNLEKVSQVRCPVFVMHGRSDTIVPFGHGSGIHDILSKNSKSAVHPPWWQHGADHGDLEVKFRNKYLKKLRVFLATLT